MRKRAVTPGAIGAGDEDATVNRILVKSRLNPKVLKGLQPPPIKQVTLGNHTLP